MTFKKTNRHRQRHRHRTKLPISSQEWKEKEDKENLKSWLSNRARLKERNK